MSNCTNRCASSSLNFTYNFNSPPTTFEEANVFCEESNGTLAKELNTTDYTLMNYCCRTAQTQRFKVGLVSNRTCYHTHPYFWVGSIAICVDKRDFKFVGPSSSNTCQTASIKIGGSQSASNVLNAKLNDCNESLPFICERPNIQQSIIEASNATNISGLTVVLGFPEIIGVAVGSFITMLLVLCFLFPLYMANRRANSQVSSRKSPDALKFQKNSSGNAESQEHDVGSRLVGIIRQCRMNM